MSVTINPIAICKTDDYFQTDFLDKPGSPINKLFTNSFRRKRVLKILNMLTAPVNFEVAHYSQAVLVDKV